MREKSIVMHGLLVLMFLCASILMVGLDAEISLAQSAAGCCGNPGVFMETSLPFSMYCADGALQQNVCCPADSQSMGGYDPSNPFMPSNQANCIADFFKAGTCDTLSKCEMGCCYDPGALTTDGRCSQSTAYICSRTAGTDWQAGPCGPTFHSCESTPGTGDPSESEGTADLCSAHNGNQAACLGAATPNCFWCPTTSKCYSTCLGNCADYSSDVVGADRVCDPNVDNYPYCYTDLACQGEQSTTCMCGSSLAASSHYCCAVHSTSFASADECTSECQINCGVNQLVENTRASYSAYGYTSCQCGELAADFSADRMKYCCQNATGTFLKSSACFPKGSVFGTVYDNTTQPAKPFEGATVMIVGLSATTDEDGAYKIDGITPSDYTITAFNGSFLEQSIRISVGEGNNGPANFYLNKYFTSCDNPKTLPDISLTRQCSMNTKGITLRWENPCPNTMVMFQVFRNGTNASLATFTGSGPFTFTDTGFEWEKNINYSVRTTFTTVAGNGILNDTVQVFSGYEACIGNDGKTICTNNRQVQCAACTNIMQKCAANDICVGPDINGLVSCVKDQECLNLGNPFGVFYQRTSCEYSSSGDPNPCYYDYSKTTVDSCKKCSSVTSCSSFLSEDACLSNMCGLGPICEYHSTIPELGKGFCYKPGETSGDNCGKCNELFMGCGQSDCKLLGSCVIKSGVCQSCNGNIHTCKDYTDEVSCNGGVDYGLNMPSGDTCGAVFSRTKSLDSCGLGNCRWVPSSGRCITDEDGDGVDDISVILPPSTVANVPNKILKIGDQITFKVTRPATTSNRLLVTQTYFCLSKTECCPNIPVTDGRITLSPEYLDGVSQGVYKLYYYSTYQTLDRRETVKSADVFLDIAAPTFDYFNYTVVDYNTQFNSNVTIQFTLDENANCVAKMNPQLKAATVLTQREPKKFIAKYNNVTDGTLSYVINCTDFAGNSFEVARDIKVDRVSMIFAIHPNYIAVKTRPVELVVDAAGAESCTYQRLEPVIGPAMQTLNKMPLGGFNRFSGYVSDVTRGSYTYIVSCEDAQGVKDYDYIRFTFDDVPPKTSISFAPLNVDPRPIIGWFKNDSRFIFSCVDPNVPNPDIRNYPPVFGCNGTRYCAVASGNGTCSIGANTPFQSDIVLTKVAKTATYCYQSKDNGGSIEVQNCSTIKIDSLPPNKPTIKVNQSRGRYFTSRTEIDILLNATDRGSTSSDGGSGVKLYVIRAVNSSTVSFTNDSATVFPWTIVERPSGDIEFDISNATIQRGQTIYIDAYAVDMMDQSSEYVRSTGLVYACSRGVNYTICSGDTCYCNNCGDGDLDDGEECDYGSKNSDTGACTTKCTKAKCGDGYLYNYVFKDNKFSGNEECDDGNNITGDGCGNDCRWEKCGDSFQQPSEQCDDGNTVTSDACINCYRAKCGDGFTWLTEEECDNKDPDTLTGCNSKCKKGGSYSTTCSDGIKNVDETDVDCGGSCPRCTVNKKCKDDADCITQICEQTDSSVAYGTCIDTASKCSNGKLDSGEADVDCGSICATKCADGKKCKFASDCASKVCTAGLCVAATCSDGVANGLETDVDCGGSCAAKCADGSKCGANKDCESGVCKLGYCEESKDKDKDGMDDIWEMEYCDSGHCNPDGDMDNDNLTNLEEFRFGTDPTNKDTDGDGWLDGSEIENGTDPLDPTSHPEGFPWWIIIILLLIILIIGGALYYANEQDKKKKRSPPSQAPMIGNQNVYINQPIRPSAMQPPPAQIRPMAPVAPAATARKRPATDHSDIFTPFDSMYKSMDTKPGAKDLADGEMPGWMKDKGGVWHRLEKMNKEELNRLGKDDVNVHTELTSLYGKRIDKKIKDSLSKWVLAGIITKSNIEGIITALAKEGKLNKAALRYIMQDMLEEKKLTKTEMAGILSRFADDGVLSKKDADELTQYLRDISRK